MVVCSSACSFVRLTLADVVLSLPPGVVRIVSQLIQMTKTTFFWFTSSHHADSGIQQISVEFRRTAELSCGVLYLDGVGPWRDVLQVARRPNLVCVLQPMKASYW